ncbi:hypothetical protein BDW72DRAFT_176762 [Aspergillus terricola var. indicus]
MDNDRPVVDIDDLVGIRSSSPELEECRIPIPLRKNLTFLRRVVIVKQFVSVSKEVPASGYRSAGVLNSWLQVT